MIAQYTLSDFELFFFLALFYEQMRLRENSILMSNMLVWPFDVESFTKLFQFYVAIMFVHNTMRTKQLEFDRSCSVYAVLDLTKSYPNH